MFHVFPWARRWPQLPPLSHGVRCLRASCCEGLPARTDALVFLDLQKLKHTESDKLQVQIQAYLDNVFDVGALLEDAETKNAALERVEELEENISHVSTQLCGLCLCSHSARGLCRCPFRVDGSTSVVGLQLGVRSVHPSRSLGTAELLCGGISRYLASEGVWEISGR